MATHLLLSICILFSIIITLSPKPAAMAVPPPIKGAYWPSWTEILPPSSIDTSLFTHIYYAFLNPSNTTYKFEPSDSTSLLLKNFTTTLHGKTPPPKSLYSIAGGDVNPHLFAKIASQPELRSIFITSAIDVAREFGFDGMDLDWEFPKTPKEMDDFSVLLQEWRAAIQKEAQSTDRPPLLLTAAVYFAADFFLAQTYRKYPVESITKNLDWINVMCYDLRGSWDTSATGAPAGLYDPNSNLSTSYGLTSWVRAGVPGAQIVMGSPLYGRTWTLKDPNVNGIGAPAVAAGPGDGVLTFSQVEHFNMRTNASVVFDEKTVSSYSYSDVSWIGFDDPISTTIKIRFAQALGLRGYFFWALSFDREWKISTQASKVWKE